MNNIRVMSRWMTDLAPEWIEPTQARSREKVQKIVDAARRRVVETQSLDLKMTDIARAAGVAVGTLYQFFPSRTALIQKLFAEEMRGIDASVAETFLSLSEVDQLANQIEAQLLSHVDIVKSEPAMMVIWASASVDPVIAAADFANTRRNAAVLSARMQAHLDATRTDANVEATALLVCHLWSSVVRLCLQASAQETGPIIRNYAQMIATHTQNLHSSLREPEQL